MPRQYTFEEYLAWKGENQFVEWLDGEIVIMSPASFPHQRLVSFINTILKLHTQKHGLGTVVIAPFTMRLEAQRRGREPDILFVAREQEHLIKTNYLDGPADVAVEIVSPDSVGRDRGEKFVEYEAGGVKEYWLIDPERQQAEFYRLGSDHRYHATVLADEGIFHSQVIAGFWLRVEWLWQLPDELTILRELGIN